MWCWAGSLKGCSFWTEKFYSHETSLDNVFHVYQRCEVHIINSINTFMKEKFELLTRVALLLLKEREV